MGTAILISLSDLSPGASYSVRHIHVLKNNGNVQRETRRDKAL
jgi:hypothetical protein